MPSLPPLFPSARHPSSPSSSLAPLSFLRGKRATFTIIALVLFLILDSVYLNRLIRGRSSGGFQVRDMAEEQKSMEDAMVAMLVRTGEAIKNETALEDIAGYADRARVLHELDAFSTALPTRWPSINASTLTLYQESLAHHHAKLFAHLFPWISRSPESPRPLETLRARYTRPRGIVIPVGKDHTQYAIHLIAALKHVHGTKLPIQVVYAGHDDLPSERRAALRSIAPDVETFDLLDFFDEKYVGLQGGGWAIKILAILASPFEETIIVDADAVFLQDPELLFEDPGYLKTGTLFFRDREIFPGDGNVHAWWKGVMKGREPSELMAKSPWWISGASREEQESGVIVFDKSRKEVMLGLAYVGYLNTKAVREPVTYANTYGDKESFWMGFELVKVEYHMDTPYASIIGQLTHPTGEAHSIDSRICSDHLLHLDRKGRPFWFNGSLFQEKGVKSKGFFLATHWAPGTVDWFCEPQPWCMKSIREQDVHRVSEHGFDRVLTDMIGSAYYWEGRFPTLIEKHC